MKKRETHFTHADVIKDIDIYVVQWETSSYELR